MSLIVARLALNAVSELLKGTSTSHRRPGLRVKSVKFEPAKILAATERAQKSVHVRSGAYVRGVAKRLIRKGRTSRPGQSPKSQTGQLKKYIFFAPEPSGVVIGPASIEGNPAPGIAPIGLTTETLEFGGKMTVTEVFHKGRWVRRGLVKSKRSLPTRTRTVKVERRPYMGPALQHSLPKVNEFWADSVK
tara:strand:- start:4058 stop:4627 length:570 start_codon:yes stop_codon:yes gene_type:complete